MKLLLTSSGLHNESLKGALRGMLDKPVSECNLVFISTAANARPGDKTWLVRDLHNTNSIGWKNFEILDVAAVGNWDKKIWWPIVEQADVIFVGGGHSGYLSYWLQQSGLFDAMPELLKTKVYVGVSAGSMVAAQGFGVTSAALNNQSEPYEFPLQDPSVPEGQISRKTFGFVDFLFRPHWGGAKRFDTANDDRMRQAYAVLKKPIYLVDDDTGIKIVDGKLEVISEGKWLLVDHE